MCSPPMENFSPLLFHSFHWLRKPSFDSSENKISHCKGSRYTQVVGMEQAVIAWSKDKLWATQVWTHLSLWNCSVQAAVLENKRVTNGHWSYGTHGHLATVTWFRWLRKPSVAFTKSRNIPDKWSRYTPLADMEQAVNALSNDNSLLTQVWNHLSL